MKMSGYVFGVRVNRDASSRNDDERLQVFDRTLEIVRIILITCLQNGGAAPCSKQKALSYLRKHVGTYFTHPYFETVKEFVESFELPASDGPSQAILMSKSMKRSGNFSVRLPDDLSERICAAYHALAKCKGSKSPATSC
jgi:hypothetical protein